MPLRDAIFVNTAVGAEPENGRAGQLLEAVKVLHKQVPPPPPPPPPHALEKYTCCSVCRH